MLAITGTFALPTCATVLRCKKLHLRTGHVEAPVMANTFRFPYLCFCPHSCILIDSLCLSFDFDTIDFQHTSFQNLMVALFWLQILQCLLNLLLISFEKFLDVNTGVGVWIFGDFFRCPRCNDCSAAGTAFRSDVNDIVCSLNNIQIVFNNNDRIPALSQSSEDFCQFVNIGKMKTGCRLVKDVHRSSCAAFAEFCGQFDTLCLTTG